MTYGKSREVILLSTCFVGNKTFIVAAVEEALLATASCLAVAKARVRTMKTSLNTATFILIINLIIIIIMIIIIVIIIKVSINHSFWKHTCNNLHAWQMNNG